MAQPKVQAGEAINRTRETEKQTDIRLVNIRAAKRIADIMRTSLGPKGMDKLIETSRGELLITNDGATVMKNIKVVHPTANFLVQTSKAQDVEAGDGTTSVVVLAGALLDKAEELLQKEIHPYIISDAFQMALEKSIEIINQVAHKIDLSNEEELW